MTTLRVMLWWRNWGTGILLRFAWWPGGLPICSVHHALGSSEKNACQAPCVSRDCVTGSPHEYTCMHMHTHGGRGARRMHCPLWRKRVLGSLRRAATALASPGAGGAAPGGRAVARAGEELLPRRGSHVSASFKCLVGRFVLQTGCNGPASWKQHRRGFKGCPNAGGRCAGDDLS